MAELAEQQRAWCCVQRWAEKGFALWRWIREECGWPWRLLPIRQRKAAYLWCCCGPVGVHIGPVKISITPAAQKRQSPGDGASINSELQGRGIFRKEK